MMLVPITYETLQNGHKESDNYPDNLEDIQSVILRGFAKDSWEGILRQISNRTGTRAVAAWLNAL